MMKIYCMYKCGTELWFNNKYISKSGKLIPLEIDSYKAHNCDLNPKNIEFKKKKELENVK